MQGGWEVDLKTCPLRLETHSCSSPIHAFRALDGLQPLYFNDAYFGENKGTEKLRGWSMWVSEEGTQAPRWFSSAA